MTEPTPKQQLMQQQAESLVERYKSGEHKCQDCGYGAWIEHPDGGIIGCAVCYERLQNKEIAWSAATHTDTDRFELIALADGRGESAEWGLCVEYQDEPVAELKFHKDWPEKVNGAFLRSKGFKTRIA